MLLGCGCGGDRLSSIWFHGRHNLIDRNAAVTTTYSVAGHPVSSPDGTTFSTDDVGNLTKIDPPGTTNDRAYAYAYDAYSRMTCAKVGTACTGTGLVTYTLDALDRVLSRVGTATKTFTYSGASETIARTVEGTNTLTYI